MKKAIMMLSALMCAGATASGYTTTESETLKVWFDDFTIENDGSKVAYLKVYENDGLDYSAFNMTFIIPKGLRVNRVKQGRETVNDIFLSERAASTHSIACNILPDGTTLKVIGDSSMNDDLYHDDEDGNPLDLLYTIGLVADDTLQPGEYTIEMTGIKFVLKTGDASVPADDHVYATLTVTGVGTGIEELPAASVEGKCHDLQGRPVQGRPEPGSIVVCNGRKILVK